MVIETDVAPNVSAKAVVGVEGGPVDHVGLQGMEEGFGVGVLSWAAAAGGALANPQRLDPVAEARSGVLHPAIAVKDEPTWPS